MSQSTKASAAQPKAFVPHWGLPNSLEQATQSFMAPAGKTAVLQLIATPSIDRQVSFDIGNTAVLPTISNTSQEESMKWFVQAVATTMLAGTLVSCSTQVTPQEAPVQALSGNLSGTIEMVNTGGADLSGMVVRIYTSMQNLLKDQPLQVAVTGSGGRVSFQMQGIPFGTYYLAAWRDNDGDGTWNKVDYVAIYGTHRNTTWELAPIYLTALGPTRHLVLSAEIGSFNCN